MLYGLAFIDFLVAAIIAVLGVHGISLTVIVGITAIGGALLSLAGTGWLSAWPGTRFRRVPPA
jgi:hypothetical protein